MLNATKTKTNLKPAHAIFDHDSSVAFNNLVKSLSSESDTDGKIKKFSEIYLDGSKNSSEPVRIQMLRSLTQTNFSDDYYKSRMLPFGGQGSSEPKTPYHKKSVISSVENHLSLRSEIPQTLQVSSTQNPAVQHAAWNLHDFLKETSAEPMKSFVNDSDNDALVSDAIFKGLEKAQIRKVSLSGNPIKNIIFHELNFVGAPISDAKDLDPSFSKFEERYRDGRRISLR